MARKRTKSEQAEILNKPVADVADSHPAVRALTDDSFVEKSDVEAFEIGNALRELLTGQRMMTEQVARLSERMDKYEKVAQEFNADKDKFIQEVLDRAEHLKATGEEKDRIIAKGAKQFEDARKNAKANQVHGKLLFEEQLRNMPKETIVSPGVPEIVLQNGQQVPVVAPDVIRIKHKVWMLMPNVPTEVPAIVAERFRQIQRGREELRERQAVLQANLKDTELVRRLAEINKRYGSPTEAMQTGSTA